MGYCAVQGKLGVDVVHGVRGCGAWGWGDIVFIGPELGLHHRVAPLQKIGYVAGHEYSD